MPYWAVTAQEAPIGVRDVPEAVDVAIVGGGFTGLWTALQLMRRQPGRRVALFEAQSVGFGASGRNAGYLMSWMHHSPQALLTLGVDTARSIHRAAVDSVREVITTIGEFGIDCDLMEVPVLWTSSNAASDRRISRDLEAIAQLDSPTYRQLTQSDLRSRVNCPVLSSGYEDRIAALVNPAKLVRGLACQLVERGLTLLEHTPVTRICESPGSVDVETPRGAVKAQHVVLARNAWASWHEPFRRRLSPYLAYDVYTEPLSEDDWKTVGWDGCEGMLDRRFFLINYRRTADGRIMFGGVDGRMPFGARISPNRDRDVAIFAELRAAFDRMFPALQHVKMQFGHGGPVAMTPSLLPQVGALDGGRVLYSHGYCGHGVAQSNLCATILADLMDGEHTERSQFPFVGALPRRYPPEPVRYLGALATRAEGRWFDRAGDEGHDSNSEPFLLRAVTKVLNR